MTVQALEWRDLASCRGATNDELFLDDPGDTAAVTQFCTSCPVRKHCLDWALTMDAREGTWGGLTEAERAPLHNGKNMQPKLILLPAVTNERRLSTYDRVELQDLSADRSHVGRRQYRLKLGELYCQGVSRQELLATGVNDRMVWRSIKEYRELAAASARVIRRRERSQTNFQHLAESAPTASARAFWSKQANAVDQP